MNSIKTKGMFFSLSLITFAILTLGFCSYYRFKSILLNEVDEAIVRIAQESANHLNDYIDQFITPLIGIANSEDIQSMDWDRQKHVLAAQINPDYLNVFIVDKNGIGHDTDEYVINLSDRDYVKKALKGEISFSEVIISRKSDKPVIMIGVPIVKDKEIKGAVIASLDVDFLTDYASTHGYGDNGKAYIISDIGTFISRPKEEKQGEDYNLFSIAAVNDEYTSFSEFVKESKSEETGYGVYSFEGRNIVMGYSTVDKTNWKVYIGTDEADTLESLAGLKRMIIIIMLVTSFICVIVAYIIVRRFTDPIIELDNLFAQGAQGDLTIRFTPKSKDEIGRVGISFNRMMDKIKTLTQYDPLTSLLNQYVLEKDIEGLLHNDEGKEFSLIMVAIDKFSFINETFGYKAGDAVLSEAARRISGCVSSPYKIYRYKGDEFVVLYADAIGEEALLSKSYQILSSVKESYKYHQTAMNVNISMGVFTRNEETKSEDPVKAVTQAKNYAKYLGSNQLQKFNQHIYRKLMIMNELQADIITGLKEEQFFLVYQPLYYLDNESIAEVETLIRWRHPEKGLLYPDQFIDLAEQAGTIVNIDQWVLESACKQLKAWKNNKKQPIVLSVNISAKSFETKSFIPNLLELIKKYEIDPSLLQLEITERMVIKHVEESIEKLNKVRAMGIHVAIDDFGIGYSSLSYIVRLPIDSIKIDKSFVQNINTSKEAKAIISAIINLCKSLNLMVIAEGIENRLELEYLKLNECDIGQGYYFSKPISIRELDDSVN